MAEEEFPHVSGDGAGGEHKSLDERLRAARSAEVGRTSRKAAGEPRGGYRQGSRVLSELIAGVAGGAIIGWVIDRWLGTSPWLLLVMMALGVVAAFRSIYRISKERPE